MTGPPTFLDSLSQLLGGRPKAVIYGMPPTDPASGGEYRDPRQFGNSEGDTVYVDPSGNSRNIPLPFVLGHEMGHRAFAQNDPNRAPVDRPVGSRDPGLVRLAQAIRSRVIGGQESSEKFAQAFGNAVADAQASATHPPYHDPRADPGDTQQIAQWVRAQPLYSNLKGNQIASAKQPADATAVKR